MYRSLYERVKIMSELKHLVTEKDLEDYENYLNSICPEQENRGLPCLPVNLIGRYAFLRITAGTNILIYEGVITEMNEKFITLKPKNKKISVIVRTENIVSVAVLK